MRVTALTFDGYAAGKTAFPGDVGAGVSDETWAGLNKATSTMASLVAAPPAQGHYLSIVIIGHSDLNDTNGLTLAQRRASEQQSAVDRATAAWDSIKLSVSEKATAMGAVAGQWWETSQNITWALVYAGIGQPKFGSPINEDERSANRRVVVLISEFPPPV